MVAHSSVLSHKKLSNAAKLLYVWICSKRVDAEHKSVSWGEDDKDSGFCQKTNEYFSDKMGKGETYISQLIAELEKVGFIFIKRKNIQGRTYRRIWCTPETISGDEKPPSAITKSEYTDLGYRSTRLSPEVNAPLAIAEGHIVEGLSREDYQEDVVEAATTSEETQIAEPKTDGYILASALLNLIRKNKKHYSKIARHVSTEKDEENTLSRWAKDFDMLLTRDAIAFDEAVNVLKWCQKDTFWQGQILSGNKFRKQYETLQHAMNGGSTGGYGLPDEHPEVTEKVVKAYGWLINNPQWKPNRYQMPKFIEAAERVVAFIDDRGRGLTVDELVTYLRDCLQKHYREKDEIVHPGNMKSDYTWDVLIPQYLENIIGAL
jgi:hypothetical protein